MRDTSVSPHDRRRIAVAACVAPRTVERWLRGGAIRSTCEARITAAVAELGIAASPPRPTTPGERWTEIDPAAMPAHGEGDDQ